LHVRVSISRDFTESTVRRDERYLLEAWAVVAGGTLIPRHHRIG
jgi:hypothetical protein